MPVLPEVGSTMTVPCLSTPASSMASIMATPMRSFTDETGLKNSSLHSRLALTPWALASRSMRTSGVSPMVSMIEL